MKFLTLFAFSCIFVPCMCALGSGDFLEYSDTNYWGADIAEVTAANPAECLFKCLDNVYCAAWTFAPPSHCWLKHSIPPASYAANVTSGKMTGRVVSASWEQNTDRYGGDYRIFQADQIICVMSCYEDSNCWAWTWSVSNTCWLKFGIPDISSTTSSGLTSGKMDRLNNAAISTVQVGYDRYGDDGDITSGITSAYDCRNLCWSADGCHAWVWDSATNKCYRKPGAANLTPKAGVTSGYFANRPYNDPSLCISTSTNPNAGTSATINLKAWYLYPKRIYTCSINGIGVGETKCCTGSLWGAVGSMSWKAGMDVTMSGNTADGVEITSIQIGTLGEPDGFNNLVTKFDQTDASCTYAVSSCTAGLTYYYNCDTAWLDSSGHGGCCPGAFIADNEYFSCDWTPPSGW